MKAVVCYRSLYSVIAANRLHISPSEPIDEDAARAIHAIVRNRRAAPGATKAARIEFAESLRGGFYRPDTTKMSDAYRKSIEKFAEFNRYFANCDLPRLSLMEKLGRKAIVTKTKTPVEMNNGRFE